MTHIVRPTVKLTATILLGGLLAACSQLAPQADFPASVPAQASSGVLNDEARYEKADWRELPGWSLGAREDSLKTFVAGCARIQSISVWQAVCAEARSIPPGDPAAARAFFESRFTAYRVSARTGGGEGLITGYYEPVLQGSRERSADFPYPVYGLPDDLIVVDLAQTYPELQNLRLRGRLQGRRLLPYFSRAEIESPDSAFSGRAIAWVGDQVDLFFLQIQGSGQIEFSSGERIRVGFADHNGYPYRSLGRSLVERGELRLEEASMQGIKAWAAAHPGKLRAALDSNPRFVFFRELALPGTGNGEDPAGPPGALGVPLTGGYSIAVDPGVIPLGAPVYLATTLPLSKAPLERLVVAQDTGTAIRGAVRADFFWGTGPRAGEQAGRMRQQGKIWLLWPRGAQLPKL